VPRSRDMAIFVSTDRQTDRQTIALPLAAHARPRGKYCYNIMPLVIILLNCAHNALL
jgi:hypothetical protein